MIEAVLTLAALAQPAPAWKESDGTPRGVVQVVGVRDDGAGRRQLSFGSGTVVSASRDAYTVLTVSHCLYVTEARLRAEPHVVLGGRRVPAKVVKDVPNKDLALLEVPRSGADVAVAEVATEEGYAPGTGYVRVGYPDGQARAREVPCEATGHAVTDPRWPGWRGTNVTTLAASGHSGGGVFRKSDGALVGVVQSRNNVPGTTVTTLPDVLEALSTPVAKAPGSPRPASSRPAVREVLADKAGTVRLVGQTPGKRYRVTLEEVADKQPAGKPPADNDIPVKE